eukprot:2900746-Ditylum_brightwellii.AAC.1
MSGMLLDTPKGQAVEAPVGEDGATYRGQQKIKGALHPDGLLSMFCRFEDMIVPVPLVLGWVHWSLSPDEMGDALDLPSCARCMDMGENSTWMWFITVSVPGKITALVTKHFDVEQLSAMCVSKEEFESKKGSGESV